MADQIETVSDMMNALQSEIESIKNGDLPESKARIVGRYRGLQLRTAELQLQYARLARGHKANPGLLMLGQHATNGDEPKT